MAQRSPRPASAPPTRAQARARRLAELHSQAEAEGTTEAMFPTSTPTYTFTIGLPPRGDFALEPIQTVEIEEAPPEGPLAVLAHEIGARLRLADRLDTQAGDHRLAAALQLAEAKRVCAEIKMPFKKWALAHLKQSFETIRQLAYIGASENPRAAMETFRVRNAGANRIARERKRAEVETLRAQAALEAPAVAVEVPSVETAPAPTEEPDGQKVVEEALAGIPLLDGPQSLVLADAATARLPAKLARAHVKALAAVLGMEVVRGGGANFFVTVETMLEDLGRLEPSAQAEFLRRAGERTPAQSVETQPEPVHA